MAKKNDKNNYMRSTFADHGKATWLRERGKGDHPGFDELFEPGVGKTSKRKEQVGRILERLEARDYNYHKRPPKKPPDKIEQNDRHQEGAEGQKTLTPAISEPLVSAAQQTDGFQLPQDDLINLTHDEGVIDEPFKAEEFCPAVPLPSEKAVQQGSLNVRACREGQAAFRVDIIRAYGRCAVTGCCEEAALEAAHIVPYVNNDSNIIPNGVCLRADIHELFDRNLVTIDTSFTIRVDGSVCDTDYLRLNGKRIWLPSEPQHRPSRYLLDLRRKLYSSTE
jgi:hypothetical protein